MVLTVSNTKHTSPNVVPPDGRPSKPLPSQLRRSLTAAVASRRRARANASSRTPEHAASAAARKKLLVKSKRDVPMIQVKVQKFSHSDPESSNSLPTLTSVPMSLPRRLPRSDFPEVSRDAILAVAPDLADTDFQFIRDFLPRYGNSLLRVLASVRTPQIPKNVLPREVQVTVEYLNTSDPPTHMIGLHGEKKDDAKMSVTLFPAHNLVFAANCANLPHFPSITPPEEPSPNMSLPIHYMQLPFPEFYPSIHRYLYSKNKDLLSGALFLPTTIPDSLRQNPRDQKAILSVATELAKTFTPQVLVDWTRPTYRTWANMTRLGIIDDPMWDAMDMNWEILITAIAMGTGNIDKLNIEELHPVASSS